MTELESLPLVTLVGIDGELEKRRYITVMLDKVTNKRAQKNGISIFRCIISPMCLL
ncbi:MAG: hypothetical protein KAI44_05160 [Methylococcales bacterium]|nr:hypothetical protein [Methylococcales bacterium]